MIKKVSNLDEFIKEVKNSYYSILKVSTTWCGPCKLLAPEYQNASNDCSKILFLEADADIAKDIAKKYEVSSVPTLIIFKKWCWAIKSIRIYW